MRRELTQEQAARDLGVSVRTIARWEADGISELGRYKLKEKGWL